MLCSIAGTEVESPTPITLSSLIACTVLITHLIERDARFDVIRVLFLLLRVPIPVVE